MTTERVRYGEHPEQFADLTVPGQAHPQMRGTVAIIHGGYWKGRYTLELMEPMVADLVDRGWACANLEYRRLDAGGGWPLPIADVTAACEELADRVSRGELPGPLIVLGHSVGGQLALLVARELGSSVFSGALALAPVTDVVETWRAGLGTDAAARLLEASEGDAMVVANAASPRFRLPIGVPVSVVHGADDDAVPIHHTRRFVREARAAGDDVRLFDLDTLDHLAAIEPSAPHWPLVVDALERLRG